MNKKHFIIPIFVPHLGCPHDCVFCNQIRITGLATDVTPDYVEETIENHLKTLPRKNSNIEVAFYGGSFTGINEEVQKNLLKIPHKYKIEGKIDAIRLSTRPDYIDERILHLLKDFEIDTIELGVQSLVDEVLIKNGRGHTSRDVYKAANLIKGHKFNLGLQMMVGLLGDTRENIIYTAKEFIKLEPFCVRIYPTLIIKDTQLAKLYKENLYTPLSLREAVGISTDLLMLFEHFDINVIRIGLQVTETIQLGKDVVAGPFHPAFRQLVESNIYRMIINQTLQTIDKKDMQDKIMKINVNEKLISNVVGQKSKNIKSFINEYNFKDIKIYKKSLSLDEIEISIDNFSDKIYKRDSLKNCLYKKAII